MNSKFKLFLGPAIFLSFIAISQFIIPSFSPKEDVLFFTKWNMFSSEKPFPAVDLQLGENSDVYLFRDLRGNAKLAMNIHTLFFLLNFGADGQITALYRDKLLKFCNCQRIQKVYFEGTVFQHIILKADLPILKRTEI